jgi:hypothetical protein
MTKISVMEMPRGSAMMMSPRASMRIAEPLAPMPAPSVSPGRVSRFEG